MSINRIACTAAAAFFVYFGSNVSAGEMQTSTKPIAADWSFSGHRSSSAEDRNGAARRALEDKARKTVAAWNLLPGPRYHFVGIVHSKRGDDHSKTQGASLSHGRSHRAWGKATAYILYRLE